MIPKALHIRSDLEAGRILRRYKRFLADIEMDQGVVTAHCANTGTMRSCWEPGDYVLLARSSNPQRKLPYTWIACQRVETWVGIDTGIPNKVVAEAARVGQLPGFSGLLEVRTEVPYGRERSRIDVWARDEQGREVYLEVKNTTLKLGDHACFPDAVTTRGAKHLRELQAMVEEGHRAAIVFLVNRGDVEHFDAARSVDPAYSEALDQAAKAGVVILPLQVDLTVGPQVNGKFAAFWSNRRLLAWTRRD